MKYYAKRCFVFTATSLVIIFMPVLLNAQANNSIAVESIQAFQSNGMNGVVDFANKNKDRITEDSVTVLTLTGKEMKNETVLKIALVLAETLNYKSSIAWCNYYLGKYYDEAGKENTALDLFAKSLPIFIELNDLKGEAYTYDNQGMIFIKNKNYSSANEAYLKLIKISQKLNNNYLQGWGYKQLGDIYYNTGDNTKAIQMYLIAIDFFAKVEDDYMKGSTYYGLGLIYTESDDISKALEVFNKSLSSYESSGNVSGQTAASIAMGEIYKYMNNYQKAVEMYSDALTLREKEPDNMDLGIINSSLAKIYMDIGEIQKAKELYAKALLFSVMAKNKSAIAQIYVSLGDAYSLSGNKIDALKMYAKSLPYIKESKARYQIAELLMRVGEQMSFYGSHLDALETYSQALPIYEAINDYDGQGTVNIGKGKVFAQLGQINNAFESYSNAESLIEKSNVASLKADLYLAKASLSASENKNDQAYNGYENALTILEKIRTETGLADMKMSFTEKISQSVEEAALFMIKTDHRDKAFQFLESIKARTLLDQLAEKNIGNVDKGLHPKLKQSRDKLVTQLSFVRSSLTKAIDESSIKRLQNEKSNLEQEWDKLNYQIRFQNPVYTSVLYPDIVSVNDLQKKILKNGEVLLNYFVTEKETYVYLISVRDFQVVKLPDSTGTVEKEVQEYQRNLQYNRPVYESNLYNLLIEPVIQYIKEYKILIIAPDGFLTLIPFESIIVEYNEQLDRPKYLIEDYTIKYIQSATMFSLIRMTLKKQSKSDSFVGFGDPVYDYENFKAGKQEKGEISKARGVELTPNLKGISYNRSGGLLNRLEGSGIEVKEIANVFGIKNSKVLTRLDAKEENIKNTDLKKYGYIVISCHGLVSDQFQSLVLSQIPNSGEDGYLTIDEIMNLDWNAKLVVLSACQTGKGKIRRGEGVVGLTRAVMHAGTSAAIVSLWNVSDEGTKELMIRLFKNIIQKKMTKEEALRKAKIEMLGTAFSNPFFWSSFVMYGE